MQPDLPWNVAGIPPEAREAARAAARREGLSVGEWLTRRILRGLMEGGAGIEPMRDAWRYTNGQNAPPEPAPVNSARESSDMLARISRSELDSQEATRRIEDQLRGLARRIDQAERSQSENSRAMSKATTEINIAAREQAQAFDQLGAHVVGLNDRLARVERDSAAEGLRDAVKALHQGLSRVADQMGQTAHQSASQIAALAGSVEQVAGKLVEARGDVDRVSHTLEDRIGTVEARMRNWERDAYAQSAAAEKNLSAAVEKTLKSVETTDEARKGLEAEFQRQAAGLTQLNETLDHLSSRFAAGETQHASAVARLEEGLARLEARGSDPGSERRLQNIEYTLSDIATRLEKAEHSNAGATGTVEQSLRDLASRVDAADKRHRDAVAELRSAVKEATGRLESIDPVPQEQVPVPPPAAPPQPVMQPAPPPAFDLPPFPDQAQAPPYASADVPPFHPDENFGGHPFGADAFAAHAAQQAGAAGTESFLAAARRSARAAAESAADQHSGPFGGFAWSTARHEEVEQKSSAARYGLMALLAILIVAAIAAGAILSRNLSASQAGASVRATPALPLKGTASALPAAAGIDTQAPATGSVAVPKAATGVAAAPGSPVVPSHTAKQVATPARMTPPVLAAREPAAATVQPAKAVSPFERLSSLADTGSAKAELLVGLKYLDGDGVSENDAEAAKWLERAAKQNQALAAYRLGTLYERGHGVPADPARAAQWYESAAKLGNRKAMHNLAVAFADGAGVQKDLVVAAQWFTRAANLGLADSQFNLAVLYERGMGVQQSLIDAYKWYAVAAQQGDQESKSRIEALSTQLSAEDKAAAQKAAESFHPDAPERTANTPPDLSMVLGG